MSESDGLDLKRCPSNQFPPFASSASNSPLCAFKTIPISSGESMPYGIIYSKEPSDDASKFLDIVKTVIDQS